jgi:TonB family protein
MFKKEEIGSHLISKEKNRTPKYPTKKAMKYQLLLSFIAFFIFSLAFSQEIITLQNIESEDIKLETETAVISFSKKDILADYNKFKESLTNNNLTSSKYLTKSFQESMHYLANSKKQIVIEEAKANNNSKVADIYQLLKNRTGNVLLAKGLGKVYNKTSHQYEQIIGQKEMNRFSADAEHQYDVYYFAFGSSGKIFFENSGDPTSTGDETPAETVNKDEVFVLVDIPPSPQGGMGKLNEHIVQNLKYPAKAKEMKVEGRVFVQFIVNVDGTLSDFTILKGIGFGCEEEAIRVIKEGPKWIPGKNAGKAVRVKYTLPLTFKLPPTDKK